MRGQATFHRWLWLLYSLILPQRSSRAVQLRLAQPTGHGHCARTAGRHLCIHTFIYQHRHAFTTDKYLQFHPTPRIPTSVIQAPNTGSWRSARPAPGTALPTHRQHATMLHGCYGAIPSRKHSLFFSTFHLQKIPQPFGCYDKRPDLNKLPI